jgi:type II secretory pathway pseudopilin PulG
VQNFLDHCDQLGALIGMPVTSTNGACHITVTGALVPLGFDVWVDGNELRIGSQKGTFSAGGGDPRTAIARELVTGWPYALWGRGSIFATHVSTALGKAVDPTQLPQLPIVLRVLTQISEVGFGVRIDTDGIRARAYGRTIWANPTDVAEQVAAIPPMDLLSGKADQAAADIAAAHRDAPFAGDLAAGPGGMMVPVATLGVLAAVAIPAFMDYTKKSKVSEAALQLNRLGKNAKVAFITTAEFPKGTAALTPAASCCGGPKNHCVSTPADWATPVWQALDFQLEQPSLFQYSYASDGATFTATAVGDLDCDGTMITYTLNGTADQGNPHLTLTEPPPNSD